MALEHQVYVQGFLLLIFADVYDSNPYNQQISCHIILYQNIQSVMFIAKKSPARNISLYSFSHHILFFYDYINNNKSHNMNKPNLIFLVIVFCMVSFRTNVLLEFTVNNMLTSWNNSLSKSNQSLPVGGSSATSLAKNMDLMETKHILCKWRKTLWIGLKPSSLVCVAVKTWWDLS